ncbi:TPA: DndE family protein [Pseudomonas aeruginosa]|uniref:DndE family protein n=1 Tax=Pseudomonas aeruginosa TaxID=287 RepID=UPI001140D443|nr:DndE family protein [Pseudomonas aeruginosa]HCL2712671.1 DndE family protein [Pseudomonas aeruginosa EF8E]MCV0153137.1 DndE family protein [Pseudomonas aeruginosa]HBO4642597.1 DndE family protein [Pseudomonas aeruginosa]HBP1220862.1 DUF1832 domain-containing protein [Pseudomonas aeruginosa]HCL2718871.1 DndE family protein [Pseudomonas aeruginosa EF8E]
MVQHSSLQIGDIARADFRTSAILDAENTRLQKAFGFQFRYSPARLAIAMSLSDESFPPSVSELNGKPIRGDTLFGQDEVDLAAWASMIVEHSGEESISRRRFQELVGAHWARGLNRLYEITQGLESNIEVLVETLLSK